MKNSKLDEFAQKLQAAAPDNLKSVILYGSAVTGEFHDKHSDLNLLCIFDRADANQIEALREPVEWWTKQGHRAPLVFSLEELKRSADVFAIELLDMKSQRQIIFGQDVLADISLPLPYHALQVERELRTNWLRFRQAMLTAPKKSKVYLELMVTSVSAFASLFRHALIALGEPAAENKREAIAAIGRLVNADPGGFYAILDFREGKRESRDMDVEETLVQYFAFVEAVADKVDRRLEPKV